MIETLARTEQSSKILASSNTKIERAKLLFNEHVDMDVIAGQLSHPKRDGKTPKMFLHGVYEECRRDRKRIVLPEAFDPRVLRAAAEVTNKGGYDVWNMKYDALVACRSPPVACCLSRVSLTGASRFPRSPGLADVLLLGNKDQVRADAARFNADISKCEILDYRDEAALIDEFAAIWTEERKAKGATYEQSVDLMADRNVFGTMLCKTGRVDGMVSGAACTTVRGTGRR